MPNFTGEETVFTGEYGSAEKLTVNPADKNSAATVACWLLTHPQAHSSWSQYMLVGLRLGDYPDMPPAILQSPKNTHEIMVFVLNPEEGPYTSENLLKYSTPGDPEEGELPILSPINIFWQFKGTDDECNKLTIAASWGVVFGILWPETGAAPQKIRDNWAKTFELTLRHLRGEPHLMPGGN